MRYLTTLRFIDTVAKAGSIRRAAETLSITSTALNRRILAFEEELGEPIFERLSHGVRLSTAGELLIGLVRQHVSDVEKVKSQIADLTGERRGHVSIACSQALLPYFLPEQIAQYRKSHPAVTFGVHLRDRAEAEEALVDFSADLAVVFEPVRLGEVHILASVRQTVSAVMSSDHPLASNQTIRLSDCTRYPVCLPTNPYGVRHLIDLALIRSSVEWDIALESDSFEFLRRYPAHERLISFQIPIGLPESDGDDDVIVRPMDNRDVSEGVIHVCQLKGRTLPVAAAKFAAQLERSLVERFEKVESDPPARAAFDHARSQPSRMQR